MSKSNQLTAPWAVRHVHLFRTVVVLALFLFGAVIVVPLFLVTTGRVTGAAAAAVTLFCGVSAVLALMPVKLRWRRVQQPPQSSASGELTASGSFVADQYGPNGHQVARFLNRVVTLSPAQWDEVRQAEVLDEAWLPRFWRTSKRRDHAVEAVGAAESTAPQHEAIAAVHAGIEQVLRQTPQATASGRPIPVLTLRTACVALIYRDSIPPQAFAAAYAPFDNVIPCTALS